jgi:hypothetical protein
VQSDLFAHVQCKPRRGHVYDSISVLLAMWARPQMNERVIRPLDMSIDLLRCEQIHQYVSMLVSEAGQSVQLRVHPSVCPHDYQLTKLGPLLPSGPLGLFELIGSIDALWLHFGPLGSFGSIWRTGFIRARVECGLLRRHSYRSINVLQDMWTWPQIHQQVTSSLDIFIYLLKRKQSLLVGETRAWLSCGGL